MKVHGDCFIVKKKKERKKKKRKSPYLEGLFSELLRQGVFIGMSGMLAS